MSTPLSCVDAPAHYTQGKVECVVAQLSAFGKEKTQTFCVMNAMKYMWRCELHEDGTELKLKKLPFITIEH